MYAIEEEKLSKPQEHIDLSFDVIKRPLEDGVRKIDVAEAMPTNQYDETNINNRMTTKIEAAKVIANTF